MSTVEPLVAAERPSWFDRQRALVAADPRARRLVRWLAPTFVTVLAGVLRLWNLGSPYAFVFDETYYVKDAWSQWNLGYTAVWPDEADQRFLAGDTQIFSTEGSFSVHPPLGRWLIGIGMVALGPDSTVGWRVAGAVTGTALVLVLFLVARSLTGSTTLATVAGYLLAIDGLAISMSRVAVLDIFLAFFILLAFWFVLLDRRRFRERLREALASGQSHERGPVLWQRPWIVAAGAAAGAASAVKWSGLYALAALGLYLVIADALARRRRGVRRWAMDAALRQGPVTFILLVPAAVAVYLASWTGWLVTDGGYDRQSAATQPATGVWGFVPPALQSLWRYHQAMYTFHVGLDASHAYRSPAWQWPLLVRPTSMFFRKIGAGSTGCDAATDCVQNIYSMPNPLIWYAGIAAAVYLVYRVVVMRGWREAFVLVGFAATYLPWLLLPQRTVFQFYTIAMLPFVVLALTMGLRDLGGRSDADPDRRAAGQFAVMAFVGLATVLSAFWYPVVTGATVPYLFWQLHNWLPSWV